jgi:3-mercaptopyruvate sulfurtransferase SseA
MSKKKFALAFSLLFLASLACSVFSPAAAPTPTRVVIVEPTFPPQSSDLPATPDDVPRVPLEEALAAHSAGAAVFLDVRDRDSFASSHIRGAMNIALNEIELNPTLPGVDKDEWIITYCT